MNFPHAKKTLLLRISLVFIIAAVSTYLALEASLVFFGNQDVSKPTVSKQQLHKNQASDIVPEKTDLDKNSKTEESEASPEEQNNDMVNETDKAPSPKPKQNSTNNTPSNIYAVQPVIFFASDTPYNLSTFRTQVDVNFEGVQAWYKDQLGGKTFNLLPAVSYRSSLSESQLKTKYSGGIGMWVDGLGIAASTNDLILCDDHRFYYFVTPLDNVAGGMIGAENLGCSHILPGTASIPNQMGRLIGGIVDPDWPEWWADEAREAQGGVAHEIGHGLGGSCIDGVCNGLPHAEPGQNSIMYEWWTFGTTGVFLDAEKNQILKSPFIG